MKFCFEKKDFIEQDINPNKLAVIGEYSELSWIDFEQRVNLLVTYFKENQLDKIQNPVIIYGHKSVNMLVSIYAMMKLEIAYIPVDLIYPKERIQKIVETANTELIINTSKTNLDVKNTSILKFELNEIKIDNVKQAYKIKDVKLTDPLVYIIFTSGSTGTPKGVQISTQAVQSFTRWMSNTDFNFETKDVFVNTALLSFDLSVFEVMTFGVLGATLLLNSKAQCSDPNILMSRISKFKGSIWVSTPSFALTYARIEDVSKMETLHSFLFCGEVLPHSLAKKLLQKYTKARVLNTYGPTEATVATTFINITKEIIDTYNPLPVGKSKEESKLIIEDKEIVICGPNVSVGYLKNEALNAEKFTLINKQRAFKTGDLGYIEDELLFFYGRNDDLVKLHGYRIELNEITAALNDLSYIKQGETIALKRNNEVKKIVALVALNDNIEVEVDVNKIKTDLEILLPHYMVPSNIKFVKEIPLNQNGKSDKKLLQEIYQKR